MAKKSNREKLKGDSLRASRIEQVLAMAGWKDIEAIFQDKYDENMNKLIAGENPDARGAINVIQEIMNGISTELQFGENARQKYNKLYLNITIPQGE